MNKIANEIPNRIKQPAKCCKYCGKSYIKKSNLDKHIIICELLEESKKKKIINENIQDNELPSQRKMYQIIIELTNKIKNLEDKIETMNKYVIKKKKLINAFEWLNTNIIPGITFDNLDSIFIIDEDDINYLFNNNITETINYLLNKLNIDQINNSLPIYSFIQKNNIIYIFENKEIGWIELDKDKFAKFLNKLTIKILCSFKIWKRNNETLLINDEKIQILCDKTISKLMGTDFKNDNYYSKIKNIFYNKLKIDLLCNQEEYIIS